MGLQCIIAALCEHFARADQRVHWRPEPVLTCCLIQTDPAVLLSVLHLLHFCRDCRAAVVITKDNSTPVLLAPSCKRLRNFK